MVPHADTICTINTLNNQERLRDAASQRVAASVDIGQHSRIKVAWLSGALSRLRDASQGWLARPLTTGSAKPAHRMI
jgi:hypothetical protein